MLYPRAVAVVMDGDRFLIMKRFVRNTRPGACARCEEHGWSERECPGHHYAVLPGGHVEEGETIEAAVLRELHEETTLRARVDRLLWADHHGAGGGLASYFLMAEVTGTPKLSGPEAMADRPDNHYEVAWASAAEFDRLNLVPTDIRARLAQLLRRA
ncbi:MAG TPA: NUDIX domain-containing protein [Actinospica sp.]|jgi:8-oxo-dGTP pyrophosphatase MutT (NUDIX family)|nr:NUDIX domain-containing protein [Actinospica sp.]